MKLVLKLFGGLVILLILALVAIWFYMDVIIKAAVERVGPEVTGTEVRLDSARLSPLDGSGSLNGFVVGNPAGFEHPNAFTLGAIDLEVDATTLREDVIVVHNINIVDPKIFYENGAAGDNFKTLMDNIEKNTGGSSDEEEGSEDETKVIIEKFSLSGATITVKDSRLGGRTIQVPMPDLVLTDIGRNSSGATVSEASAQIFQQITAAAGSAVFGSALVSELRNQVDGVTDELDAAKDKVEGLIEGSTEELGEAKEKIEGLLDGFGF